MSKRKWEINCYEAMPDGSLVIHLEDQHGANTEVVVPAYDVPRLTYGAIDALQKTPSRR